MHYRNGREGRITSFGELRDAKPGNDYCNGDLYVSVNGAAPVKMTYACLCDCLHVDDVVVLLKDKGLDRRPAGK